MKKLILACVLLTCMLVACNEQETAHEHVPDGADCQRAQYCAECGEQLAEQGPHEYPEIPEMQEDGYLFYVCRVCENIKIVNEDGLPVVPVE